MKVRSILLGTVGAVAMLSSAYAADMYRAPEGGGLKDDYVPVNSWTGFYLGVNAGYAWTDSSRNITYKSNLGGRDSSVGTRDDGGFAGGQIGYNWQGMLYPHIVLGVEADIQVPGASDHVSGFTVGGLPFSASQDLDYFGTVRGRVGYALNRTLVYFTGGFAYGQLKDKAFLRNGVLSVDLRGDNMQTGYVLGGGVEYKIAPSWSLKGEYQYINFGGETLSGAVVPPTGEVIHSSSIDGNFHTVRIGLNYHVGASYEPLK